jgi:hypothetical protein
MRTNSILASLLAVSSFLLWVSAFAQNPPGYDSTSGANPAPANAAAQRENYDPLLDLPPLPHRPITLMGGIVVSNDEVMNRMTFQPFATKQKLQVHFDTRTRFFLDGKQITEREIKPGQRVYLDTMLNGTRVFAKTIWIRSTADSGLARGQIMNFDPQRRVLTVHDELSNQPLKLQLTSSSIIRKGNQPGSESDLVENALVDLDFGARRDLRSVTVLATPGTVFTFAGPVTYIDLSQKLIAIDNRTDGKKYDISMEAVAPSVLRRVHEGSEVSIAAVFDGERYSARSIEFASANRGAQ